MVNSRRSLLAGMLLPGIALVMLAFAMGGGQANAGDSGGGYRYHDPSPNRGLLPPAGEPRDLVTGQSVIGTDERIRIPDTTIYPFSAVAYLELYNAGGDIIALCSGTFIGPDAVLTAGHCLWDINNGRWNAHRIRVVPGKDEAYEPFGSEFATDWWVPDGYVETNGAVDFDWGLIRLPDDALTLDTSWLQVAVLTDASLRKSGFTPAIIGYPVDLPPQTMWGHSRKAFNAVEPYRLFYDIDTSAGQSGSAIWSLAPGPTLGYLVGIHTQGSGGVGDNSGSRIDQELLNDLLAGCSVMACTIDFTVEGSATPTPTPKPQPTPVPTIPSGPRPYKAIIPAIARN